MPTPRPLYGLLIAFLILLAAQDALGQAAAAHSQRATSACGEQANVIRISHRSGRVWHQGREQRPGRPVRLASSTPIYVCVDETNSAAYTYTVGAGAVVAAPEVAELSRFMTTARPTLTNLLATTLSIGLPDTEEISVPVLLPTDSTTLVAPFIPEAVLTDAERRRTTVREQAQTVRDDLARHEAAVSNVLGTAYTSVVEASTTLTALLTTGTPERPGLQALETNALRTALALRAEPDRVEVYRTQFADYSANAFACRPSSSGQLRAGVTPRPVCSLTALPEVLDQLDRIRTHLPEAKRNAEQLALAPDVLTASADVARSAAALARLLERDPKTFPVPDPAAVALARIAAAERTVDNRADLLKAIAGVEAAGIAIMEAAPAWESRQPLWIRLEQGREVTVTIAPTTNPTLARAAVYDPLSVSLQVMPQWRLRPSAGLSLLYAHAAVYDAYEIREDVAGQRVVARAPDQQDQRFSYALDLALTYPFLDARDRDGFTLWAPVLSVAPLGDTPAFGVGVGGSYSMVRLSTGLLWARHNRLDGVALGAPEPSTGTRWQRSTYLGAPGRFYVSLAVIGWP